MWYRLIQVSCWFWYLLGCIRFGIWPGAIKWYTSMDIEEENIGGRCMVFTDDPRYQNVVWYTLRFNPKYYAMRPWFFLYEIIRHEMCHLFDCHLHGTPVRWFGNREVWKWHRASWMRVMHGLGCRRPSWRVKFHV